MTRATQQEMDELHHYTVRQAITLMKNGRPLINKEGDIVRNTDGSIVFMPPSAAELAAAARILKDNGIDAPEGSGKPKDGAARAMQEALKDAGLDELEAMH